jgi:hypothetical protein
MFYVKAVFSNPSANKETFVLWLAPTARQMGHSVVATTLNLGLLTAPLMLPNSCVRRAKEDHRVLFQWLVAMLVLELPSTSKLFGGVRQVFLKTV